MSLAELYGIGKSNRNALSDIKKVSTTATNKKLVSVLDDDEENSSSVRLQQNDEQKPTAIDTSIDSTVNLQQRASSRSHCMICRIQQSRYNCPNCNIPYCSLQCYRSNQHINCSQDFSKKVIKEELGSNKSNDIDDRERMAMMDLLRRHKLSDGVEGEDDAGSCEEGEVLIMNEREAMSDVDLDSASVEQLLQMLSEEERMLFEKTMKDKSKEKAQRLMDKLLRPSKESIGDDQYSSLLVSYPWWEKGTQDSQIENFPNALYELAIDLSKQDSSKGGKGVNLSFNIVCVLLSYVYLVRHMNMSSLQDAAVRETSKIASLSKELVEEDEMPPLEPVDDADDVEVNNDSEEDKAEKRAMQKVIQAKVSKLLPFLRANGEESKILLESVEEASLFFAARVDDTLKADMAEFLLFIYKDVNSLLSSPRMVEMDKPARKNDIATALCDLAINLKLASRRKLIFYSAFWLRLDSPAIASLQNQVESETQRLQLEVDRLQDQARYEAANEAIQQQIVLP